MELKEHNRKEDKNTARSALSDKDLKLDLIKQYGTTKWASKLISKIMEETMQLHDISFSIGG